MTRKSGLKYFVPRKRVTIYHSCYALGHYRTLCVQQSIRVCELGECCIALSASSAVAGANSRGEILIIFRVERSRGGGRIREGRAANAMSMISMQQALMRG